VQKAQYPDELQASFRDRRWSPVNPATFLNYEGAEIVIVGASDDLEHEFGREAADELEKDEQRDLKRGGTDPAAASRYRLYNDLKLSEKQQRDMPLQPLTEGEWK